MKAYAGRTLMLLENFFPMDTRVNNEAISLSNAGYKVTVIALRNKHEKRFEILNNIRIYRIPELKIFSKTLIVTGGFFSKLISHIMSAIGYSIEYFYFTIACLCLSFYIYFKEGFDVVHAHNPPDTLIVIGMFYKIFGKKFIFDHHDLSPELYLSRFNKEKDFLYKLQLFFEKLNIKFADLVIATNNSYKNIEIERGKVPEDKIFVVRNGPDINLFSPVDPDPHLLGTKKTILAYVGVIGPQDGLDYLIRSLKHLVTDLLRKDFICVIIGSGDALESTKTLCNELHLNDYVIFTGYVPDSDMIRYLSSADICLDPNPSSPLNDYSTWIKVMEYMALGKPIVSFELKETKYSARESAIYVKPNDEMEYAKAINLLMENPDLREEMGSAGKERVDTELSWQIVSKNLLAAYASLI